MKLTEDDIKARVSCAAHDSKIAQQSVAAAEKTSIITP